MLRFIIILIKDPIRSLIQKYRIFKLNTQHHTYINYDVRIINNKNLSLGENVQIQSGSYLHCGGLDWSDGRGFIDIGTNVFIGPQCILFGAGGIRIGDNTLIAPAVKIMSHSHFYDKEGPIYAQGSSFQPITIKENVYIGTNASILPGVTINEGCIIGAGAVVTEDIPPYSLAVGVPAKVIRKLNINETHEAV